MAHAEPSGASPHPGNAETTTYVQATLGFTLLYAVCVSFYYRSWLFGCSGAVDSGTGNVLNVAIGIVSIGLAVYVAAKAPFRGIACVVGGIVLLAVGSIVAYAAVADGLVGGAYLASIVCAGAGIGLAVPCCYELFVRYAPSRIAGAYGVVASLGMLCALAAEMFGPEVLLAANLAFLLGALVLLGLAQKAGQLLYGQDASESSSAQAARSKARPSAWKRFCDSFLVAAVCVFAVSVVYGALSATASHVETSRDVAAPMAQVGGLIVSVLFLVFFGLKKRRPSSLLFNVVFGILGAAILLLPFLQSSYSSVLYAFSSAAWKLMLLVLLYLVVTTPARSRRELFVGMALACALPRVGLSAGSAAARFLNIGIESEFMRMTAIAVLVLYLILMVVWFINSFERKQAEGRAKTMDDMLKRYAESQEDVRGLRLKAIAETAELTNREREVLAMMARGRDLGYICDELCLSRNTVKGYQKAIYAKLGIHSKQELIDLVDRA